jgi:hypothetical protein
MRAWIQGVDEQHDAYGYTADKADLDLVAAHCGALRAAGATKNTQGDHHIMTCDGFTILAWCTAKGLTWAEFFRDKAVQKRFLEDPDNAAFRVHTGRL